MTWKESTKDVQLEFLYSQYYINRKKRKKRKKRNAPSQKKKNYNNCTFLDPRKLDCLT